MCWRCFGLLWCASVCFVWNRSFFLYVHVVSNRGYVKKRMQYETTNTSSAREGLAKSWSRNFLTQGLLKKLLQSSLASFLGTAKICFNWRISQEMSDEHQNFRGCTPTGEGLNRSKRCSWMRCNKCRKRGCLFDSIFLAEGVPFWQDFLKMTVTFISKGFSFIWRHGKGEVVIL